MQMFDYYRWQEKYYYKQYIELFKCFNKRDIEILKRLGITIKDKSYTEHELEMIYYNLLQYYKNEEEMEKEEIDEAKPLENGVTREEYNNVLKKFEQIKMEIIKAIE